MESSFTGLRVDKTICNKTTYPSQVRVFKTDSKGEYNFKGLKKGTRYRLIICDIKTAKFIPLKYKPCLRKYAEGAGPEYLRVYSSTRGRWISTGDGLLFLLKPFNVEKANRCLPACWKVSTTE
jgi:hypothetical protein